MAEDWKQWEGRTINGKFPVQRLLGGSEHHAVFLAEKSPGERPQTVIRFLDSKAPAASEQFQHWEMASKLKHPNLLQIFETGRCNVDGRDFFYAWAEYGEEDLSQIIPTRALTAPETLQILQAVIPALSYLHGQGLVHGSVKPSNIFAVGETVKISSDSARRPGKGTVPQATRNSYDAPEAEQGIGFAADVWSLGVTLAEALTQRLPAVETASPGQPKLPDSIPQPFRRIIENCLQVDPAKRWTVAQIADQLNRAPGVSVGANAAASATQQLSPADKSVAPSEKRSAKWSYVIALALVVLIAALLITRHKRETPSTQTQPAQAQPETPASAPSANAHEQSNSKSNKPPSASSESATSGNANSEGMLTADSRDDVLQRVAPAVSPSARRTITGKIRLRVNLNVDAGGNVTEARLQSPGPSKYFARVALEAARQWKFKPALANGQAVPSKWILRFAFSRRGSEAAAERTAP